MRQRVGQTHRRGTLAARRARRMRTPACPKQRQRQIPEKDKPSPSSSPVNNRIGPEVSPRRESCHQPRASTLRAFGAPSAKPSGRDDGERTETARPRANVSAWKVGFLAPSVRAEGKPESVSARIAAAGGSRGGDVMKKHEARQLLKLPRALVRGLLRSSTAHPA